MRRIAWIFVVMLGFAKTTPAQTTTPQPRFEAGFTGGVVEARPSAVNAPYYDDWYTNGRVAGSVGYYWTRNLKTELEHAWSGKGSRFIQDSVRIGGVQYPTYFEEFHQLQQTSVRVVWQFLDNAWVHPYVSAGAVIDTWRRHAQAPAQYQGSVNNPVLVRAEITTARRTDMRGGVTLGGGAKFYMTRRAFFNAGGLVTYAKPETGTLNLVAGFGFDF